MCAAGGNCGIVSEFQGVRACLLLLPTGAFIDYDYDDAHRLIRITDNLNHQTGCQSLAPLGPA